MSSCRPEELDRWVAGELSGAEIATLWRHVARCQACHVELRALREEQLAFRVRALRSEPRPPAYAGVAERIGARHERWVSPTLALTTACALYAAVLGGVAPEVSPPRTRSSEAVVTPVSAAPRPALLCEQDLLMCEALPVSWAPSPSTPVAAPTVATESDSALLCAADAVLSSGS